MNRTFFTRYGLLILMVVMFLVPFAMRGARFAMQDMKNDVKDWLPADFEETQELGWFARHFYGGEQFVLVTWPGCNEDSEELDLFVEKVKGELAPPRDAEVDPEAPISEEEEARRFGDSRGIHIVNDVDPDGDDFRENWGGKQERWLRGYTYRFGPTGEIEGAAGHAWFYILPDGRVFEWDGNDNLPGWVYRWGERAVTGTNQASGTHVATFGEARDGKNSPFYDDPRKLTARLFSTVSTGPMRVDELAVEERLWPLGPEHAGKTHGEKREVARDEARHRLEGLLFGPFPPRDFIWSLEDFRRIVPESKRAELRAGWEQIFEREVARLADEHDGGIDAVNRLPQQNRERLFAEIFDKLDGGPPARFDWTAESLLKSISKKKRRQLQSAWEDRFDQFVRRLVQNEYGAKMSLLLEAPEEAQGRHWNELFNELGVPPPRRIEWENPDWESLLSEGERAHLNSAWEGDFARLVQQEADALYGGDVDKLRSAAADEQERSWQAVLVGLGLEAEVVPPARQTAVLVTLSDVGKRHLGDVLGHDIWYLGRSRGRLLTIGIDECGVKPENLHVGGPPVDNVAIDEEGSRTLVSLVSFSVLVGLVLAWLSFRSLKITWMVFFVGGVSAIVSLSLIWWWSVLAPGSNLGTVDAILLSMPSLIYVLGLSGAVHIVNYYRDAATEQGRRGAAETAVRYGWWPCTIAAFTTALGLISLCTSNLLPIRKFGLFSALGVVATLGLLFTFLPAALAMFAPKGWRRQREGGSAAVNGLTTAVERFWARVGRIVIARHGWVALGCTALMIVFSVGLFRIKTSVQLLKLFDPDARIIQDYAWFEDNLGELVPMEIVVRVDDDALQPTLDERRITTEAALARLRESLSEAEAEIEPESAAAFRRAEGSIDNLLLASAQESASAEAAADRSPDGQRQQNPTAAPRRGVDPTDGIKLVQELRADLTGEEISPRARRRADELLASAAGAIEPPELKFQYDYLQRMEMAEDVAQAVDAEFGDEGQQIVGKGLRAGLFAYSLPDPGPPGGRTDPRKIFNLKLEKKRQELLEEELLAEDHETGDELWRVSLRLGALNNVDYGQFVEELKEVVEPVLASYRYRDRALMAIDKNNGGTGFAKANVYILGISPSPGFFGGGLDFLDRRVTPQDQDRIFAANLRDQLVNAGANVAFHDPDNPDQRLITKDHQGRVTRENWEKILGNTDCVIVVRQHDDYDLARIKKHAPAVVVAGDHRYGSGSTQSPASAKQQNARVSAVYTGVVPIVYKAQRTLLTSLIESILLAFVLIAATMMLLLRNGRLGFFNFANFPAGLIAMLPNIFPIILIFGFMGHSETIFGWIGQPGILVDIGTMMTASVAMGVAVDDTIHFLTWFRKGMARGMDRKAAIMHGYGHCATAMTQTTMIGGLGLSVFALSTFTPTQAFGIMMLVLLIAALVGDLIFLPALLAGPLGWFFEPSARQRAAMLAAEATVAAGAAVQSAGVESGESAPREIDSPVKAPHSGTRAVRQSAGAVHRRDQGHQE